MWFDELGISPVEELYNGIFDFNIVKDICNNLDTTKEEGVVMRLASSFSYDFFGNSMAKFVRKNHVQTDKHWKHQKIVPNKLMAS